MDAVDHELARNGSPYPALQGFSLDGVPHIVESIDCLLASKAAPVPGSCAARVASGPGVLPRLGGGLA
jgi:hypothetical protein